MKRRHPRSPRRPKFQRLDGRFVMDAEGLLQPSVEPLPTEEVAAEVAPEKKTDDALGDPDVVLEFVTEGDSGVVVTTLELLDGEEVVGGEVVESVRGGAIEDRIRTVSGDSDDLSGEMVTFDGEVSEEIFQTTGLPDGEVFDDGEILSEDDEFSEEIFQTTGMPSIEVASDTSGEFGAYDVNGDGGVNALDALNVINFIRRRSGGTGESRESLAASTVNSEFDVDGDSQVTPLDALVIMNNVRRESGRRLALHGGGTNDQINIPILPGDDEVVGGSQSLTFADIGPYGVLTVEIAEDGSVVATGNSEAVAVTVGENGQVTVGDIPLHVFVVVGADGTNELIENFGAIEEPLLITNLTFENIGEYTYFDVMINEDGSLSAVGHKVEFIPEESGTVENWTKEAVTVSVGEDGRISFGEIALPAFFVTGEDGVSELIQDFGTGDDSPIGSKMAGAKVLTLVGPDGQPIVVRVTEENGISALVGDAEKQVTLDDDSYVVIDGAQLPVLAISSEEGVYLYPSGDIGGGFTVSWPVLVDEVFAEGEFVG
jgi:Dockerin type I domain